MKIYGIDELMAREKDDLSLIGNFETEAKKLADSLNGFRNSHTQYCRLTDDIRVARIDEKVARTRENARMQFARAVDRNIREGILPHDFKLESVSRNQADDQKIIDNCDKEVARLEQERKRCENGHFEYCTISQCLRKLHADVRDAKARKRLREQFWHLIVRMEPHGVRVETERKHAN